MPAVKSTSSSKSKSKSKTVDEVTPAKRTRNRKASAEIKQEIIEETETEIVVAGPAAGPIGQPEATAPVTAPTTVPATAVKKTRGKAKKPAVVAMVTPDGIIGSLITEMRPLIAHIPISCLKASADDSSATATAAPKYDPTLPAPYDIKDNMSFLNEERGESVSAALPETKTVSDVRHFEAPYKCTLPAHYSERLMVQFQDSNRAQKLPDRTDCYCFWCCHPFDSVPCVIPADIKEAVYQVYGNFCSPECAVAYLFYERLDSNIQWERYAMLNSLYSADCEIKGGSSTGIRSAPKREVLRIFGGSMDIREFRAIIHEKKLRIDVLSPPMVSIIQTMDTKPIDFYDQSLRNVFVPTEARRLNAPGAQGLRLRRSKPIAGKESTLEFVMNIQTN